MLLSLRLRHRSFVYRRCLSPPFLRNALSCRHPGLKWCPAARHTRGAIFKELLPRNVGHCSPLGGEREAVFNRDIGMRFARAAPPSTSKREMITLFARQPSNGGLSGCYATCPTCLSNSLHTFWVWCRPGGGDGTLTRAARSSLLTDRPRKWNVAPPSSCENSIKSWTFLGRVMCESCGRLS
jgi:hypothetical protein